MTAKVGDRVQWDQYPGVAFSVVKFAQVWVPYEVFCEDEDGNEWYEPICDGDGEWEDDSEKFVVVMVGDDREFTVDPEDLEVIDADDYCGGCGQIGCTAEKI